MWEIERNGQSTIIRNGKWSCQYKCIFDYYRSGRIRIWRSAIQQIIFQTIIIFRELNASDTRTQECDGLQTSSRISTLIHSFPCTSYHAGVCSTATLNRVVHVRERNDRTVIGRINLRTQRTVMDTDIRLTRSDNRTTEECTRSGARTQCKVAVCASRTGAIHQTVRSTNHIDTSRFARSQGDTRSRQIEV